MNSLLLKYTNTSTNYSTYFSDMTISEIIEESKEYNSFYLESRFREGLWLGQAILSPFSWINVKMPFLDTPDWMDFRRPDPIPITKEDKSVFDIPMKYALYPYSAHAYRVCLGYGPSLDGDEAKQPRSLKTSALVNYFVDRIRNQESNISLCKPNLVKRTVAATYNYQTKNRYSKILNWMTMFVGLSTSYYFTSQFSLYLGWLPALLLTSSMGFLSTSLIMVLDYTFVRNAYGTFLRNKLYQLLSQPSSYIDMEQSAKEFPDQIGTPWESRLNYFIDFFLDREFMEASYFAELFALLRKSDPLLFDDRAYCHKIKMEKFLLLILKQYGCADVPFVLAAEYDILPDLLEPVFQSGTEEYVKIVQEKHLSRKLALYKYIPSIRVVDMILSPVFVGAVLVAAMLTLVYFIWHYTFTTLFFTTITFLCGLAFNKFYSMFGETAQLINVTSQKLTSGLTQVTGVLGDIKKEDVSKLVKASDQVSYLIDNKETLAVNLFAKAIQGNSNTSTSLFPQLTNIFINLSNTAMFFWAIMKPGDVSLKLGYVSAFVQLMTINCNVVEYSTVVSKLFNLATTLTQRIDKASKPTFQTDDEDEEHLDKTFRKGFQALADMICGFFGFSSKTKVDHKAVSNTRQAFGLIRDLKSGIEWFANTIKTIVKSVSSTFLGIPYFGKSNQALIEECSDFTDDVREAVITPDFDAKLNLEPDFRNHIISLGTRSHELRQSLMRKNIREADWRSFYDHARNLDKLCAEARRIDASGGARFEPTGIYVSGPPGQGKGTFVIELFRDVHDVIWPERTFSGSDIHFHKPGEAHENGYTSQLFWFHDEFAQDITKESLKDEIIEMIHVINEMPYRLTKAAIEQKENTWCKSEFVALTTNAGVITPQQVPDIADIAAFMRRFRFKIRLNVKKEFSKKSVQDDLFVVDSEKVRTAFGTERSTKIWDITLLDATGNPERVEIEETPGIFVKKSVISYDELVTLVAMAHFNKRKNTPMIQVVTGRNTTDHVKALREKIYQPVFQGGKDELALADTEEIEDVSAFTEFRIPGIFKMLRYNNFHFRWKRNANGSRKLVIDYPSNDDTIRYAKKISGKDLANHYWLPKRVRYPRVVMPENLEEYNKSVMEYSTLWTLEDFHDKMTEQQMIVYCETIIFFLGDTLLWEVTEFENFVPPQTYEFASMAHYFSVLLQLMQDMQITWAKYFIEHATPADPLQTKTYSMCQGLITLFSSRIITMIERYALVCSTESRPPIVGSMKSVDPAVRKIIEAKVAEKSKARVLITVNQDDHFDMRRDETPIPTAAYKKYSIGKLRAEIYLQLIESWNADESWSTMRTKMNEKLVTVYTNFCEDVELTLFSKIWEQQMTIVLHKYLPQLREWAEKPTLLEVWKIKYLLAVRRLSNRVDYVLDDPTKKKLVYATTALSICTGLIITVKAWNWYHSTPDPEPQTLKDLYPEKGTIKIRTRKYTNAVKTALGKGARYEINKFQAGDQSADDICRHVIAPNLLYMVMSDLQMGNVQRGHMFFIEGRMAITSSHYIDGLDGQDGILQLFKVDTHEPCITIKISECEVFMYPEEDTVVFTFPNTVPAFKDITQHLVDEENKPVELYNSLSRVSYNSSHHRTIENAKNASYTHNPDAAEEAEQGGKFWRSSQGLSVIMANRGGLCGSVYYINHTRFPKKIIGVHHGGCLGRELSYAVLITAERWKKMKEGAIGVNVHQSSLTRHPQEIVELFNEQFPGYDFEREIEAESVSKLMEEFGSTTEAPVGMETVLQNVNFLGQSIHKVRMPHSSKIVPSLFHGQIPRPEGLPAPQRPVNLVRQPDGSSSLYTAWKKLQVLPFIIEDVPLAKLIIELARNFMENIPITVKHRVLTKKETINGVPEWTYVRRMRTDTSMGFPWTHEHQREISKHNGSRAFLLKGEGDDLYMSESLEEAVDEYLKCMKKDEPYPIVYTINLKDETRAKTVPRIFWSGPKEHLICMRMFFGSFMEEAMRRYPEASCKAGVNPHSVEWHELYQYLLRFQKYFIIAGDFENFDNKLPYVLLWLCCWISVSYLHRIDHDEALRRMRWNMLSPARGTLAIMLNLFFLFFGSNPSGQLFTLLFNCMANEISTDAVIIMHTRRTQRPVAIEDLPKVRVSAMMGDDNATAFNADRIKITLQDMSRLYKELFGMVYTCYTKREEQFWDEQHDLHQITFCKRYFVLNKGICHGALMKEVIYDMLEWTKKGVPEVIAMESNIVAALIEMYHWGKNDFNEFYRMINRLWIDGGYTKTMTWPSYKTLNAKFKGDTLGNYLEEILMPQDVFQSSTDAQDQASVTEHITETEGLTSFADEEPKIELIERKVSSFFSPLDDPYRDNQLHEILTRPITGVLTWGSGASYTLARWKFPKFIFDQNPYLLQCLSRFYYFRSDVEITMRLNPTMYHTGAVMLRYLPHTNAVGGSYNSATAWYKYAVSHLPGVTLSASNPHVVRVIIPKVSAEYWMTPNGSSAFDAWIGVLETHVLNPLIDCSGSNISLYITWTARFLNPEVAGPVSSNNYYDVHQSSVDAEILSFPDWFLRKCSEIDIFDEGIEGEDCFQSNIQGNKKGVSPQREAEKIGRSGVLSDGIRAVGDITAMVAPFTPSPGIARIASDAIKAVASAASANGYDMPTSRNMITSTYTTQPNNTLATGMSQAMRLAMTNEGQVSTEHTVYSDDADILQFKNFSKGALIAQVNVTPASPTNTSLINWAVTPTLCYVTAFDANNWMLVNNPDSFISSGFKYWRGGMKYTLQIFGNAFTSYRLRICWYPSELAIPSFNDTDACANNHNVVIDVKGDTLFDFYVPYFGATESRRIVPSDVIKTASPAGSMDSACSGFITLQLLTPVTAAPGQTSNTTSYINIWSQAGEDMMYFVPDSMWNGYVPFEGNPADEGTDVFQSSIDYSQDSILKDSCMRTRFGETYPPLIPGTQSSISMHKTHSESVQDFRTYFHRPTYYGTFNTTTANTYVGFKMSVNDWLADEFVVNNNIIRNRLRMFLRSVLAFRGSLRYKFYGGANTIYVRATTATEQDIMHNSGGGQFPLAISTPVGIYDYGMRGLLTHANPGGNYMNCEIELPYESNTLFRTPRNEFPVDNGSAMVFQVSIASTQANASADVLISVGEDFSAGIQGVMPIYKITSQVLLVDAKTNNNNKDDKNSGNLLSPREKNDIFKTSTAQEGSIRGVSSNNRISSTPPRYSERPNTPVLKGQ